MKKSLMALAMFGAFAGMAHAQTAVQIYGNVDVGLIKKSGSTLQIGKRAANTLGFKGTEDLGNGLKALFQLEIRYEPDTGTVEATNRPLFQGESRVGLAGDFGMVRIGRGRPAYQETVAAFDPWHGLPTPVGFYTDLTVAGYTSQPLDPAGSSNNRWANAIWYNSNVINGFQFNSTVATKEANGGQAVVGNGTPTNPQFPANSEASANPFSISGTYNNGPAGAMIGYERNAVESKVWTLGGSIAPVTDLRLMLTYTRQDQGHTRPTNSKTKAWVLGANYAMGPGKILAGYGQKHPDGAAKTKQLSLGYEYSLSKRTYVYLDASRKKDITTASGALAIPSAVNQYDIGMNHSF
ncbi:porin [Massilia horti]|uniref:Porin n=1 Tax=Massilia horti TaxID=2562153 RepID=A0A4Y9SX19_9BURK|nr:porin [Massilia horti]TFW29764.1 porin [Massilia horti]